MSRPRRTTVDFFPHQVTNGKTIFVIEEAYGNNGYACWFKTLELLGSSPGHYLSIKRPADWRYYVAKMRVPDDVARGVLDLLAEMAAIDKELLEKGIIWSQNFVDRLTVVYDKRENDIPSRPVFPGVSEEETTVSVTETL